MRAIDLLKKYIRSGLSDHERFELEKLALDDDFLADAWEGISQSSTAKVQIALTRLNEKISAENSAKEVYFHQKLWPYAIAASFVVLMIAAFLVRQQSMQTQNNTTIAMESLSVDNDFQESGASLDNPSGQSDIVVSQKTVSATKFKEEELDSDIREVAAINESATLDQIEKPGLELLIAENQNSKNSSEESLAVVEEDLAQKASNDDRLYDKIGAAQTETQIVLAEGINSNDQDERDNVSQIVTNEDHSDFNSGQAVIVLQDRDEAKNKTAAFTPLKKLSSGLKEKKLIEETSFRAVARKTSSTSDTLNLPQPVIGFRKYQELLIQNTSITRDEIFMFGLKMNHLVKTRFKVDQTGLPYDIIIENIPEGVIQDKLIELLKSSGPWQNCGNEYTPYSFYIPVKPN